MSRYEEMPSCHPIHEFYYKLMHDAENAKAYELDLIEAELESNESMLDLENQRRDLRRMVEETIEKRRQQTE
jgi:hypothetical protein